MPITELGAMFSVADKSPGAALIVTNTSGSTIVAGTLFVVTYAGDTSSVAGRDSSLQCLFQFVAGTATRITSVAQNDAGAGAGVMLAAWYFITTADVANGAELYRINSSTGNSLGASATTCYAFTGVTSVADYSGTSATTATSTNGAPSGSSTTGVNLPTGTYVFGFGGFECPATSVSPYSGNLFPSAGTWNSGSEVGTSGQSSSSNITALCQYAVATKTTNGSQVYAPSGANDSAVIVWTPVFQSDSSPILTGIPSAEAFGSPTVSNLLQVASPTAIASVQAFGATALAPKVTSTLTGITSAQAMGTPVVQRSTNTSPQPIYDESLPYVRAAIGNRETKRVNIGLFGASITEGYPCTIDKTIETYLAAKLRTRFATSGNPAGPGYLGQPSVSTYNTWVVAYAGSGAYNETFGLGAKHACWFAAPGSPGSVYYLGPFPWTSFDIDILSGPGGNAAGFGYSIDGGAVQYISNYSATYQLTRIHIASPVTSNLVIGGPYAGTDNLTFFGVVGYNGDEAKGIQVHNYGHAGYTIDNWMANPNGRPNWLDDILSQDLDLLVMGEFGVNDAETGNGNISSATFKTKYAALIDYIRSFGYTKDILCTAWVDTSASVTLAEPWVNYRNAIEQVANEKGLQFLDYAQYITAGPGPMYSDGVHSAADGSLHLAVADVLANRIASDIGTPRVSPLVTSSPAGLASAQAMGNPTLGGQVSLTSVGNIASAQAFGNPTIDVILLSRTVTLNAIASSEVFGNPTISSLVGTALTGIASLQAFGNPSLSTFVTAIPTNIASQEAFGAPTLAPKVTSTFNGIATAEAFGNPTLTWPITLLPTGLASLEAFGNTVLSGSVTAILNAIASLEAFGVPSLDANLAAIPTGIASAQALGNPTLAAKITSILNGIATAEAFGLTSLATLVSASPTQIASGEVVNPLILDSLVASTPNGIASAGGVGTLVLSTQVTLAPSGIASAQGVGVPSLLAFTSLAPSSIASLEMFGGFVVDSALVIHPGPIDTLEAVSNLFIDTYVEMIPDAIDTEEVFGEPFMGQIVTAYVTAGIPTGIAFGVPTINPLIDMTPIGVAETAAVGTPTLAAYVGLSPDAIDTGEDVPNVFLDLHTTLSPVAIASLQGLGVILVTPYLTVTPSGLVSIEGFGSASLSLTPRIEFKGWGLPVG